MFMKHEKVYVCLFSAQSDATANTFANREDREIVLWIKLTAISVGRVVLRSALKLV